MPNMTGPAPPPSSTPPQPHVGGPPAQQQQAMVPPQQQQIPSAPTTLNRQRKRIAIIDPVSRQEVSVEGTSKSGPGTLIPPSTGSSSSTPGLSDSSNQSPAGSVEPEKLPSQTTPSKNFAAEFAANVAAAAEGSVRTRVEKEDTPPVELSVQDIPPVEMTNSFVKEPTPEVSTPVEPPVEPTVEPSVREPSPVPPQDSPPVPMSLSVSSGPPEIVGTPITPSKDNSTLSVACPDLKPGEELMYEPVSPTPLPDSPCDENKSSEASVHSKPSPFEEVINKKAGGSVVSGIEKVKVIESTTPVEDSSFEPAIKGRKKKSAASKRAALNSKPEKMGDLLDVFTGGPETGGQELDDEQVPTVTKKSPTPEPVSVIDEVENKETPSEVADPVSELTEKVSSIDIEIEPTEEPLSISLPSAVSENPIEQNEETKAESDQEIPNVVPPATLESSAPKVNGILDSIPAELRRSDSSRTDEKAGDESGPEDGEIIEDTEDEENDAPGEDGKNPKLKYDYKEDQWSPLNPEGKKQYDRAFLICLQRDPLSLQKPGNLPAMEIVKDKPNVGPGGKGSGFASIGRFDFTPGYVGKSNSRGGGGGGAGGGGAMGKRGSQGGDRKGGDRRGDQAGQKQPRVISLPSISQEVKLHKTKNAWVPQGKRVEPAEGEGEDEMAVLKKKVLAILNKLTPQKFETLVERFQELPIDSQDKLSICMELVFEKAVDEPSFSVAYAQMCKVMQMKQVPIEGGKEGEFVNFRKLLISRCQKEFEKDYMESLDRDKYKADMAEATTKDEMKKIKAVFMQMEMKLRRRSLGNIRFIGELYKLGMLTARIMHECVKKLLKLTDEESLECLCRLLTTVGKDLDEETKGRLSKGRAEGINDLSVYFKDMAKLVGDKTTSSRVRFLMQDVIDLKHNGWKKRREEAGPKTIDEVHKQIETEQLQAKLATFAPSGPPPGRRDDRGGGRRDDDRKRSQRGERPGGDRGGGGGGGGGANQGETPDGWQNVPTRVARSQYEKIDTSKLRNISTAPKVDAESMSFGPPKTGGGGGFGAGGWGRGSQTMKPSRHDDTKMQNRFAGLDAGEQGAPQGYDGRNSGGRFGRQDSVGRGPGGGYGGRNSRGGSTEPGSHPGNRGMADQDRSKAMRDFGGSRSQSVMGPHPGHPSLSREGSAPRSASMVAPKKSIERSPEVALKGKESATEEELEKWTIPLLNEYLHNYDFDEAIKEIGEKFSHETMAKFVEVVLNNVLERTSTHRTRSGELVAQLLKKSMLIEDQFLVALNSVLEFAEDLLVDVPKFWDFLAEIVAPVLDAEALEMKIIKVSATTAKLCEGEMGRKCAGGKYVAAILHQMAKQGHAPVARSWQNSGLSWEEFLGPDINKEEFLKSNKVEWTEVEGSDSEELSEDMVKTEISKILSADKKSNDRLIKWLDSHLGENMKQKQMIRVLVTCVAEACIDGLGGPTNQCKLNEEALSLRQSVLDKYLGNSELEMQALLALQHLMHRLEHPNKLLHTLFEKLYDADIIAEDALFAWEKNEDAAEREGKGVALKSTTQFFTWLKEAED